MSFPYAQLPSFQYQKFERQYQTFDPATLKFAYYPVFHSNSDRLTPGKDQDNAKPTVADPESSPAPDDVAGEEAKASPDESSVTPEAAGKCEQLLMAIESEGHYPSNVFL